MHDSTRRAQKVVATLTFRKHLYALFPSGHHLADDYCQLLVAHFRHLASCLCKCLVATNSRLPEASSAARVKSWVTFLMGWESVAAAPRLLHIVQQAQAFTDVCNVLLTQTQVRTQSSSLSQDSAVRHCCACLAACLEQTLATVHVIASLTASFTSPYAQGSICVPRLRGTSKHQHMSLQRQT